MSGLPAACDVLIVGGGSAGCVLAARLSERSSRKVVLVEAGRDTPPGAVPPDVADTFYSAAYRPENMWPGLTVRWCAGGPDRRYDQARIMGGGSSVNAMVAFRGLAADYDAWAEAGAAGWDWASVAPFFRRLETDMDFAGPEHGTDGPIAVRRHARADWPGYSLAVAQAAERMGHAFLDDMNADAACGHGRVPMSNRPEGRVSAAIGYLTTEVRARPNLTILPGTTVRALTFEGNRCVGAELDRDGARHALAATEVVLSAGALQSPELLLRAGIGPAGDLRAVGVTPLADLPGVGANLHDHPAVAIGAVLSPPARQPAGLRPAANMALRLRPEGGRDGDVYIAVANKTSWHALGQRLGGMIVSVFRPLSRGRLSLSRGVDGLVAQRDFDMLSDPADMDRMVWAYRHAAALIAAPELAGVVQEAFPAAFSERVRALNRTGTRNALVARLVAAALDLPGPVRRAVVARMCEGGATLAALLADDAALKAFVRDNVTGFYHPVGTCRMGAPDDPDAVTDPRGRVRGVGGLRVVDASLMPAIPRANTNLPTMMMAERIAADWDC
ncbi:MAG: GMC family oxidoreductase [Paracoccaceae bacterium]